MAGDIKTPITLKTVTSWRLWPVWEFAVHVGVGTLIFVIIAAGAIGLDMLNYELHRLTVDPIVRYGLKLAEYALLAADLALYIVFLYRTAARATKKF